MKIQYSKVDDFSKIINKVAEDLCKGKIVAWFQGGSEYGPRSLGFRSILASPKQKEIKDYLNNEVKYREHWRPYAPVIIEHALNQWFETDTVSPYMLFSANCKEETKTKAPGVVHEDGTSRVQTVNEKQNKKLYDLLVAFNKLTDVPILLNTSFNLGGEPIVESPKDAYNTFINSNLDVLVMENVYVRKEK
jgi:carbamoyltransferase